MLNFKEISLTRTSGMIWPVVSPQLFRRVLKQILPKLQDMPRYPISLLSLQNARGPVNGPLGPEQ